MVSPNTSLPADTYVPILKGKRAELDAVSGAPSDRLVPLFEFLDPALTKDLLARAWANPSDVVWIQILNADGVEDAAFASSLTDLFASLRPDYLAVPVLTTTEEPNTLAAIAAIAATDGRGVSLRIDVEELVDENVNSSADINATLDGLALTVADVDLVLDAGLISGSATIRAAVVSQAIRELPETGWRSIVVSFSAFPPAVGEVVPKGTVVALPRTDAAAFVALRRSTDLELVYSDYAIGVPTYAAAAFTPIPNMKYASDNEWFVHRGTERRNPAPQYRALARAIVAATYYSGTAFSPGDQQISDVATETSGPGNATTHLRIAMSRHLHVVLSRLATLGAP
ncbi:hypothetical protein GSU68_13125 [Rathayibacter sp. VKM Ac-2759]|uniref:beta family protein n=1 Tax=Rathayibacter sp. VKM Ac-2759 TaxID=2609252 RepID=UPI0013196D69|nr:hypothetical protein [Rathayibacter sp. VKM Ac-2759]QHC67413.1 hypothetical protein GSU68_13125 [Rathayibacter sp. VKM Ac-2759]